MRRMNVEELKIGLARHGVEEGSIYVLGGVGTDGAPGIQKVDGIWYKYDCERGAKNNIKACVDEAAACDYVWINAEALARQYKVWKE